MKLSPTMQTALLEMTKRRYFSSIDHVSFTMSTLNALYRRGLVDLTGHDSPEFWLTPEGRKVAEALAPKPEPTPARVEARPAPEQGPEAPCNALRPLAEGERLVTLGAAIAHTVGADVAEDFPEFAEEQHAELLADFRARVNETADESTQLVVTASGNLEAWHYNGFRMCSVGFLKTPPATSGLVQCSKFPRRGCCYDDAPEGNTTTLAAVVAAKFNDYEDPDEARRYALVRHAARWSDYRDPDSVLIRSAKIVGYEMQDEYGVWWPCSGLAEPRADFLMPGSCPYPCGPCWATSAPRSGWGCIIKRNGHIIGPRCGYAEFYWHPNHPNRCNTDPGRFEHRTPPVITTDPRWYFGLCEDKAPKACPFVAGLGAVQRFDRGSRSLGHIRLNGRPFKPSFRVFDRSAVALGADFYTDYVSPVRWLESMPECRA